MEQTVNINEFITNLAKMLDISDANLLQQDTLLADIKEWDSLAVMSFLSLCEDQTQFTPEIDDMFECKTVGDLFRLMQQQG